MVADKVLLKQRHVNKFTTTFVPTPYSFTEKTGKQGVIRSPDGKTMKRNVSHTRPDPNHHREPQVEQPTSSDVSQKSSAQEDINFKRI